MAQREVGEGGPVGLDREHVDARFVVELQIVAADARPGLGSGADLDHDRRAAVDQRVLHEEGLEVRKRVEELVGGRVAAEPQRDVRIGEVDRPKVAELDQVRHAAEVGEAPWPTMVRSSVAIVTASL